MSKEAVDVFARVSTRFAKGSVEQQCGHCNGKLVGAQASRKYRRRFVFVNTYKDMDCTQWLETAVYHIDCWPDVKATAGYIVVNETSADEELVMTEAE